MFLRSHPLTAAGFFLLAVCAAGQQAPAPPKAVPVQRAPGEPEALEDRDTGYREVELLARVIELVRQNYFDEKKVSYDRLVNSALEGMLSGLDPHSQFLHRELYERVQKEQSNAYEGVGITISIKNDMVIIVSVREDGPAARAGVMPGDQVVKIDNAYAADVGPVEAAERLRGKPGEPVKLTISRASTSEVKEFDLVRQVISTTTVKDPMLLPEALGGGVKIGYVRLLQFTAPTATELALALDKLEDAGMQACILDLRNNPGGLITSAVDVAGEFLPPGTTVVTTEGRPGSTNPPPYKTADRKRRKRDYPLAVLMNHGSASGSELVAGALQDLHRAVIVGVTSFGKGSVQSIIPVENGAAVRLTTARYFTPSHNTIHGHGITPNITATLTPAEEQKVMAFWQRTDPSPTDAEKIITLGDRQLERAAGALKGVLAGKTKPTPSGKPASAEK